MIEIISMLSEKMESRVIENCKSNPMMNTPFAGLAIMESIKNVSEDFKETLIDGMGKHSLNEADIDYVIDAVKEIVHSNLIEG